MDVVFAVLPFADIKRPAIGVSLLQAAVKRSGFQSCVEYFNLDLAETIGASAYQLLANTLAADSLVGEWYFADLVFGNTIPDEDSYLAKILGRYAPSKEDRDTILKARAHRSAFIDGCVQKLRSLQPRVVGFTTTFHQTCACLAVAQSLKGLAGPPTVIFGGANCEGEMGWQMLRAFPWIDYVSTGEADLTFPTFLENLLSGKPESAVPGILARGADLSHPPPVHDMDALPYPDYADYFARTQCSPLANQFDRTALIETSRGCWWGAKQHCTFCGLNGRTMSYRSKTPERSYREFAHLAQTYDTKHIDSVDNILDTRYIQTLFPMLIDSGLDLNLFFEVKSNLRYEQLVLLHAGGIRIIQPGIESFSNHVLRMMKKGCTGLQNIQLLRWCEELGIDVMWNILAGFPGESPSEYERQAELLPLLSHLPPPASCAAIRLDRFSPLYMEAAEFKLERVRPAAAYYYVFPLGKSELAKLAYFFEFDYEDGRKPDTYLDGIRKELAEWWNARSPENALPAKLDARLDGDNLTIEDQRRVAVAERHFVRGLAARIYLTCDSVQTVPGLCRAFADSLTEDHLRAILEKFVSAKLMIEMEGHYLSLAVIRNRSSLTELDYTYDTSQARQTAPSQPLLRVV